MKKIIEIMEESPMSPAQKKIYNAIIQVASRVIRVKDKSKIEKHEKEIMAKIDSLANSIEKIR